MTTMHRNMGGIGARRIMISVVMLSGSVISLLSPTSSYNAAIPTSSRNAYPPRTIRHPSVAITLKEEGRISFRLVHPVFINSLLTFAGTSLLAVFT